MTVDARIEASARPLRADAERNRKLILEVAAEVFAEKGLDAGFDEIARRAGVGAGTVYRRFPHRDELIEALLNHRLGAVAEMAEAALKTADPWAALVGFMEHSIEMQIRDRGMRELMEVSGRWSECSIDAKGKLIVALTELLSRAQQQGQVRGDIEISDLGVLATMVTSVHDHDEPQLWRRYLALFLDGLRIPRNDLTPLPVGAPSEHFHERYRDRN